MPPGTAKPGEPSMLNLTTARRAGAIALLSLTPGAPAQSIVGGGVLVDSDPTNDISAGASYNLKADQSRAIIGLATVGAGDAVDYFGIRMPAATYITAMTIPLASQPLGPFVNPTTAVRLENFDGSAQYVLNSTGGTDQSGSTPNSGGSVARARPFSDTNIKVRVNSPQTGGYAVLVSVYTGDNGEFVEQGSNDGPATAIMLGLNLGGPKIGTAVIASGTDVDYFGVEMKRGQILAAVTTPCEGFPNDLSTPDTVLDLIGTNGATVLVSNDDAGTDQLGNNRGSAVRYRATKDGRYFLRVKGFNASAIGRYALTAALIEPPPGTECIADFNGDGLVDTNDLVTFLGQFGNPCP